MNKKQAIKLLNEQKQIFESRTYSDRDVWRQKTASLVEQFLGKDSGEYYSFANFKFGVWTLNPDSKEVDYELKRKHNAMIGLLDNCIDKIQRNGITIQSSSKKTLKNTATTTATTIAGLSITQIVKIIIGVIIGLLVLMIWELYRTELLDFWKRYIP